MRSANRTVTRLGVALATALLSLATITTLAGADPPATTEPPPTSSAPPSSESTTPPPSTPPSSESSEPPPSSEPPETADIEVTATFGKATYATGEDMTITLTITNPGAEEATLSASFLTYAVDGITVTATSGFTAGEEFTVAAGASVTNTLTGVMVNPNVTTATLHVVVNDAAFDFTVPVTRETVSVSGTVFHDKDGDGTFDSGEGLGGATLNWTNNVHPWPMTTVQTNSAGEFSLELVPALYRVHGQAPDVLIESRDVVVPASGVDNLLFPTTKVPPDLTVDLEFTKDTYKPNEKPVVRVTLTNKGDLPLTEIAASCPDPGGQNLSGKGDGWRELAGDGVTVAPHTTTVLDVTEPMPPAAHDHGYVQVDCWFSYAGMGDSGSPRDTDRATLPGQFAEVTGHFSPFGAGIRLILTADGGGCPILAEATADNNGRFSLGRLPVGRYHYYIEPPNLTWGVKRPNHGDIDVIFGQDNVWGFSLYSLGMPTSITPLNCPDTPGGPGVPGTTTPPAPQGSAGPGLAYTGASMLVPGIAGLLALLAGTGAVLVARRRRTPEKN
jgi:hypothetical protein